MTTDPAPTPPKMPCYCLLDGKVIGQCLPRHCRRGFLRFLRTLDQQTPADLDLHLIVDSTGPRKSPPVKHWLTRHPPFHLHFTPTGNSWLNLVERCEMIQKRIRRGSFASVKEPSSPNFSHLAPGIHGAS